MKKIQILNRYSNKVLFEYVCEVNTIKKTLEQAVKENAYLRNANLENANLRNAYLRNANLENAYLENANLENAYLRNANLENAYLENANLENANLRNAYLENAYLENANLRNAYLRNANLENANLRNANLENAYLENANLRNANLENETIIKIKHLFQIIPEIGNFIAWKKASGQVIKLQIPSKAKRTCNIINRKCRAEYVKTLSIENIDGTKSGLNEVVGDHDNKTVYKVGEITKADSFDDDLRNDCTHGIHFFITRKEAEIGIF